MILWFHLLVLHRAYQEEIENQVHSRYRKKHRSEQDSYERYVRQRRIPRHSLLSVERSPWRRIYLSADDQAMITLTGFDMASFHYICQLFAPQYDAYSPFTDEDGYIVRKKSKAGQPRFMNAEDCWGMVLAWTRTRGSLMVHGSAAYIWYDNDSYG